MGVTDKKQPGSTTRGNKYDKHIKDIAVPALNRYPMKMYGEVVIQSHHFFICALNGDEWSALWNVYRILIGKPEGKKPFGRLTHRWWDIKN
jgi:hypothetical protein